VKVAYVAGPYSAVTRQQRDRNIALADEVGRELMRRGYAPIVPHNNCARWDDDARFNYGDFIRADLAILSRCDLLVAVGDWRRSEGARCEVQHALQRGIPVYYGLEAVP